MRYLCFLLFLTGCISEQQDRIDKETHSFIHENHAQKHKDIEAARPERERGISDRSAHQAAKEANRRLESTHMKALTIHKTATVKAVNETLNTRLAAIILMVANVRAAFVLHVEAVTVAANKRKLEELEHKTVVDAKLGTIAGEVTAFKTVLTLNAVKDSIGADTRTKALANIAANTVKADRGELDHIDTRTRLNILEGRTGDAKGKADTSIWVAGLAALLMTLKIIHEMLVSYRKKKNGS